MTFLQLQKISNRISSQLEFGMRVSWDAETRYGLIDRMCDFINEVFIFKWS